MRIAVDIDSTLHPYWDQLAGAARRRFGVELPYAEQTVWEIDALSDEQLAACVGETHSDVVILSSEPYPGAVETIAAWRVAGHEIHVTSHRLDAARGATARWLEAIGLAHDELHCSFDKVAYCVERGVRLLIDDSPVNLARAREAGMAAATIAHPWNRALCGRDGIVCAEDWPALRLALVPVLAVAA
jgi:beta-phosphoglucomutase-like phosphatase (HAD superfamily)